MKIANSRVHFIGIGGAGMSGLAELIHNMGATVSGSDLSDNSQVERLRSMGIPIAKGHSAQNIKEADVVVYSSAVPDSNPEIQEAKRRKIPIIPRIEVLVEVMRLKRGIAVGGTHGKTTTTSMIASIFLTAKKDPTVVVGGRLDLIKSHSFLGKGDWLIAESDESDGSFLKLSPEIAVITNIDNDHIDHYGSFINLKKAFLEFAKKIPFYGVIVACGDSDQVRETLSSFNKRVIYYGFQDTNDFFLARENDNYIICHGNKKLGVLQLSVPGRHNALNALAAFVVAFEAGLSVDECLNGLRHYTGVDRRLQLRGEKSGVKVYDDYGHHPTEIKAVIQALREKYPRENLVIAFQPHRYTRTQSCWDDFITAFDGASQVLLWDIYSANESAIEGITSEVLAKAIRHSNVLYVGSGQRALDECVKAVKLGTILVTLGAGDISKQGSEILAKL